MSTLLDARRQAPVLGTLLVLAAVSGRAIDQSCPPFVEQASELLRNSPGDLNIWKISEFTLFEHHQGQYDEKAGVVQDSLASTTG